MRSAVNQTSRAPLAAAFQYADGFFSYYYYAQNARGLREERVR